MKLWPWLKDMVMLRNHKTVREEEQLFRAETDPRVCYLTVATIPSTTAHASFVVQLAEALCVQGISISVAKVGWGRTSSGISKMPNFTCLAPWVPTAPFRAALQAILFPLYYYLWQRYEIVLTHNALTAVMLRLCGIPFIFDVHAVPKRGWLLRFALAGRNCRAIAYNSIGAQKAFEVAGLGAGKPARVIGNGSKTFRKDPDLRRRERAALGYGPQTRLVVYIGSLGPGRGMNTLRAAMLKVQDPEIHVLIAGGKSADIERERKASQAAGLGERITYLGYVDRDRIMALMNAADVLLVSYSRLLATVDVMDPMKVHEYLSTDRPIIYPVFERIVDIIGDDPGAFGHEPDDPDSLASALRQGIAWDNSEELERFRASRRITWERVAQMYDVLIRDAI